MADLSKILPDQPCSYNQLKEMKKMEKEEPP